MKYEAVLFDLDGTLLDTLDDLADSMNAVLEKNGFPPHPVAAYKHFVGDGVAKLVERTLPKDRCDEETVRRCIGEMREEYTKRWADKTQPYDGVPELLDALTERGVKMAILSNKPDDFTKLCVDKLLPKWSFEVARGIREDGKKKPDPAGAIDIAEQLNVSPAEFLYLGDTNTDMKTAVAAGMFPVGALWGFRDADELTANGAKVLIERPVQLLDLL
ncbi:MAG: HAD family hydrolase [Planctomycetes bacterium]|nr:HAD family hydrolase [Planctomycetota bacterium]